MSTLTKSRATTVARRGQGWAFVPVGLLVASTAGVGTLVGIAVRDPGFALETNYYDRAVHWDREREQVARNERLGYGVELSLLEEKDGIEIALGLTDRGGAPVPGAIITVEAFANARSGQRRVLRLVPGADGRYRAPLGAARAGLWEFRIEVLAGSERFTQVVRAELARGRRS
jgi:hypothetical protein